MLASSVICWRPDDIRFIRNFVTLPLEDTFLEKPKDEGGEGGGDLSGGQTDLPQLRETVILDAELKISISRQIESLSLSLSLSTFIFNFLFINVFYVTVNKHCPRAFNKLIAYIFITYSRSKLYKIQVLSSLKFAHFWYSTRLKVIF